MPSSPRQTPPPALVTFGRGGYTIYYQPVSSETAVSNMRTSGYSSPEDFFKGGHGSGKDAAPFEGCPVIDMRAAARTPSGVRMAISGPMVSPALTDSEVEKCPTPSPLLEEGLRNSPVGGLVDLAAKQRSAGVRAGAFDLVSVPEYMRLWRQAGARIGVVRGGVIEFEARKEKSETPSVNESQEEMSFDGIGGLRQPQVAPEVKPPAPVGPEV